VSRPSGYVRDRVQGPRVRRGLERIAPVPNILSRQPWEELIPHIARSGANVEQTLLRLKRFTQLAIEWNRSVSNLISRNDEARIVTRHIRESVECAHELKQSGAKHWLDFGSGAGFPAIPLAILGVGERWMLVESRRPKTLFMRKALQELEILHVEVYHGRLEALVEERGGAREYDGFTSRATMKLAPTLKLAEALVQKDGTAFLWKGSGRREELDEPTAWNAAWELEKTLGVGDEHTAIAIFKRTS